MTDRSKVIATAQKHIARGNLERAIAEYEKLVQADPEDVRTMLKIGDLQTKKGDHFDACATYGRVAEYYANQGFYLKSVAIYKQILKLDPNRLDVSLSLASMYEQLGLNNEALTTYERVVTAYGKAGETEKAVTTLGQMALLDPDNIPVRIKHAEALSRSGKREEAAREFESGARLLKSQGRLDDYAKVAERLLYHRPKDLNLARELAEFYLQRNDAKRALSKLQVCFKSNPKDVNTLELLARAFHILGQTPKTISVYREISKIHAEAKRSDEQARVLKKILELDPNDAEARQALAAFAAPPRKVATRDVVVPENAIIENEPELLDDDDMLLISEPDADDAYADDAYADDAYADMEVEAVDLEVEMEEPDVDIDSDIPERPAAPPDVAQDALVARLLTECDVFLRYGLKEKVIAQLERVVEMAPEHVEARARLKDAYVEANRIDDAVQQLFALRDIFAEDKPQVAQLYVRQILELDPDNAEAAPSSDFLADNAEHTQFMHSPPAMDDISLPQDLSLPEDLGLPQAIASSNIAAPRDMPPQEIETFEDVSGVTDYVVSADDIDEFEELDQADPFAAADDDEILFLDDDLRSSLPPRRSSLPAPVSPESISSPPRRRSSFPVQQRLIEAQNAIPENFDLPTPLDSMPLPEPVNPRRPAIPSLSPLPDPLAQPEVDLLAVETDALLSEIPAAYEPSPGTSVDMVDPLEFDSEPSQADLIASEAAAERRLSMPPGEIEETLDEADFFMAQGLFEEAKATILDAQSQHTGHPLLMDKMQEIVEMAASSAVLSENTQLTDASEIQDDAFALAEKLAEELGEDELQNGSDVLDVESVFAQFKKGVEEQVGLEDSATHFDLGIAYKEMGLLDDAISEFTLAMVNPHRECLAHTMIGLCQIEGGRLTDAVASFKKGLYAESKTAREELGLYFELGLAYEALDDTQEALYYYQKVEKKEPTFRDVTDRILKLTKKGSITGGASQTSVDVDSAFDDLLRED